MLWKGVYQYQYMSSWQRFNKTSLPDEKEFCSSLTMENIIDAGYNHVKRVWEDYKIPYLGQYQDLYMQAYTLLLAYVFESKSIEMNDFDPA